MHFSTWTLLTYGLGALAAPTATSSQAPAVGLAMGSLLSQYLSLVENDYTSPMGNNKAAAPVCNLDNAVMPVASPTPLPTVSANLKLAHVAIGRGTQNYTCANDTAVPVAVGAKASLFNASCLASTSPHILAIVPSVALQFNLTDQSEPLVPTSLLYSGEHFFSNMTTPVFNLNTANQNLGVAPCAKNSTAPAPKTAPKGQWTVGDGAVAWLKLTVRDDTVGSVKEVYRINTAGGCPPATCQGMDKAFVVEYAAEYWFYESS